mmetsp:Transcript_22518/g.67538  ORF Transcript_22518/g.67538 Transcript_22518/m.67538 type:complete len:316 (+) Transcript_22518:809-1756(+)
MPLRTAYQGVVNVVPLDDGRQVPQPLVEEARARVVALQRLPDRAEQHGQETEAHQRDDGRRDVGPDPARIAPLEVGILRDGVRPVQPAGPGVGAAERGHAHGESLEVCPGDVRAVGVAVDEHQRPQACRVVRRQDHAAQREGGPEVVRLLAGHAHEAGQTQHLRQLHHLPKFAALSVAVRKDVAEDIVPRHIDDEVRQKPCLQVVLRNGTVAGHEPSVVHVGDVEVQNHVGHAQDVGGVAEVVDELGRLPPGERDLHRGEDGRPNYDDDQHGAPDGQNPTAGQELQARGGPVVRFVQTLVGADNLVERDVALVVV